jgi:ABC-type glycerol-3-phosphate transport system substrate-binding protein
VWSLTTNFLEKKMLNKILLALLFGLFLAACGDDVANDSADAELPPLTEEAATEEAPAEEAPAEEAAE